MNFNKFSVLNKSLIASTLLFGFSTLSVASTDSEPAETQPASQIQTMESQKVNNQQTVASTTTKDIERITVDGDEQTSVLRYNYIRAEDSFFNAFNQLTDNTDFHITCEKKKRHSFTRIKLRDCESGFEKRITAELISEVMMRNRAAPSLGIPLPGQINAKQNKAREKQIEAMEVLIQQSPQLQEKLIALIEAKQKLDDARTSK